MQLEGFSVVTGATLILATFCAGVCVLATSQQAALERPRTSTLLLSGLVVLAAFIAFPSNPAEWSLGNLVLYLAAHTLDPLRILGVLMLGGGLFYAFVYALYFSRRR